jgi:hypothetical protein
MRRLVRLATVVAALVAVAAATAVPAAAQDAPASTRIGIPPGFALQPVRTIVCGCVAGQIFAPPGVSYASPYAGTIVEWGASLTGSGTARLVVLRPIAGMPARYYTLVSVSEPQLFGPGTNYERFPTSQPVEAGDAIAIYTLGEGAGVNAAPAPGAQHGSGGLGPDGTSVTLFALLAKDDAVWIDATVVPAPPAAPVPAPPAAPVPPAPPAGAPRPPAPGCHIPSLARQTLSSARSALTRAGCRLGSVSRRGRRRGGRRPRVVSQSPRAGRDVAAGTRVRVVLR